MKSNYKSVYTAFDPYPSYKGSGIHIEKVTNVMGEKFNPALLLTLSGHREKDINQKLDHFDFPYEEENFLKRAEKYSVWIDQILTNQHQLQIGHFRDIWGGLPILKREHIVSIFEVNGLPSIELINRYPYISRQTLAKIRALEDKCLHEANLIICPSNTIRNHLLQRQVISDKIHIISNGAEIPPSHDRPAGIPDEYIIYFGALQPWQGIDILIKSLSYLRDKHDLKLIICSSHKEKYARPYQKLVQKLGFEKQVIWKHQLNKSALHALIQHAVASIVPLTECARNLEQGCSPLKIFESMACKTPIIAADLPVVRELLTNDEAKFFRADRPAELARCIRLLADYSDYGEQIANNAYLKLQANFTWHKMDGKLERLYDKLLSLVY